MKICHRTTLYFHKNTMEALNAIHKSTGLHRKEIVITAMNRALLEHKGEKPVILKGITYQAADPGEENWHKFHICFTLVENEYFQDIRLIFRESASLFISMAIIKYYELFLDDSIFDSRFLLYIHAVSSFFHDNVQSWVQHWGLPLNTLECIDNYLFEDP